MKQIAVLGGGISGLSLTWYLRKILPSTQYAITIYESSQRCGGWIKSMDNLPEGFHFEAGPRGFRPARNGRDMLRLVEDLKLTDKMILPSVESAARYLIRNGSIEMVPTSFMGALTYNLTPYLVTGLIKDLCTTPCEEDDESIFNFFKRHFNEKLATDLIDPVVSGTFAGNIKELSIASCYPHFWDLDQKYGSIQRGMVLENRKQLSDNDESSENSEFVKKYQYSITASFEGGMETIIKTMQEEIEKLPNTYIKLSTPVESISPCTDSNQVEMRFNNSNVQHADHVFSTLAAPALLNILPSNAREDNSITSLLQSIPYSSVAMVHVAYDTDIFEDNEAQPGFGCLYPSKEQSHENIPLLGIVYDSVTFQSLNRWKHSHDEESRFTFMFGGAHAADSNPDNWDKDELVNRAENEMIKHFNADFSDSPVIYTNWLSSCIPQYTVGHNQRMKSLKNLLSQKFPNYQTQTHSKSNLTLLGTTFGVGVGISDAVSTAKSIAEEFGKNEMDTVDIE